MLTQPLTGSHQPPQPPWAGLWLRLRLGLFCLACALAVFVFANNYFTLFPTNDNPVFQAILAGLFLITAVWLKRNPRWAHYWTMAYAFFVATAVWLATTLVGGFGNWTLRWLDLTAATPQGLAVAKVGEAVGAVAIILALSLPAGLNLEALYLRRGNLKWAIGVGVLVILNFTTAALMATADKPRDIDVLGQLLLWGVVFSAANGLMEELWFRGLLLGRLTPHLGAGGAIVVLAIAFSLSHLGAVYLEPAAVIVFLLNTFTHALVLGYLVVKTETLWGAVLYHMAMDIWLFIGPLAIGMGL